MSSILGLSLSKAGMHRPWPWLEMIPPDAGRTKKNNAAETLLAYQDGATDFWPHFFLLKKNGQCEEALLSTSQRN